MSRPVTPRRRRRDPWLCGADMEAVREFLSRHCDGLGEPAAVDGAPCLVFFRPNKARDRIISTLELPAETMSRSVFAFDPAQRWDLAQRRHLVLAALLWYRRTLLLPRAQLDAQQADSQLSHNRRAFAAWKKTLGAAIKEIRRWSQWDDTQFDALDDRALIVRVREHGDLRALVEFKRRKFDAVRETPRRNGRPRKDNRMQDWLLDLYRAGGLTNADAQRDVDAVRRQFGSLFEPYARPPKKKNPP